MEELTFILEISRLRASLKRRLRTARKYREKAEQRLQECVGWLHEQHLAELLQANLYQVKRGAPLEMPDWEQEGKLVTLVLDPSLKPHEEVAKRFKRAKKLKIGLPYAEQQLKQAEEKEHYWQTLLQTFESITTGEALAAFKASHELPTPQQKSCKEEKAPSKPYWEYQSASGIAIWVGKNGAMNEQLTFRHAHGNDIWLHVSDYPGSHVVIRLPGKSSLEEETLQDACQLALHHSKARGRGEGEIVFTQVKYVKRMGKAKGKVQIAQEKRIFVREDKARVATLHRL